MPTGFCFSAKDDAAMDRIGYRFGEIFFPAALGLSGAVAPLTLSAYGARGAGKTTFLTAFLTRETDCFTKENVTVTPGACAGNWTVAVNQPLEKAPFRYRDFTVDLLYENWQTNLSLLCEGKPAQQSRRTGGLTLLEHAPIRPLMGADLFVVVGRCADQDPKDPTGRAGYLGLLRDRFAKARDFAIQKEAAIQPKPSQILSCLADGVATVQALTLQGKKDAAPSAEGRVIGLFMPRPNKDLSAKLAQFRASLRAEAPVPPPRRVNPSALFQRAELDQRRRITAPAFV